MSDAAAVGLCFDCRWMRKTTNRRGTTFYRCLRAETDPQYTRYPPLPVRDCAGHEPADPEDYLANSATP